MKLNKNSFGNKGAKEARGRHQWQFDFQRTGPRASREEVRQAMMKQAKAYHRDEALAQELSYWAEQLR